uniref:TPM domain-containing protein n=1 Tax=Chlorobium chlorochromatii (strain CaD3) TaxID=340177 RepID=Q3APQ1_CHLCH
MKPLRQQRWGATTQGIAIWLIALLWFLPIGMLQALTVPALTSRVNDYANMISPNVRAELEAKLAALETTDSTQLVILTVPSLEGDPIEDFSIRVAEAWKIGQKGTDNGVLLIVSQADRKVRIEVGYGLEGKLTDLQAGRIIRNNIAPAFKMGEYDLGFVQGTNSIIAAVRGEFIASDKKSQKSNKPSMPLLFVILFVFYILSQLMRGHRQSGPMAYGGPGGFYGGGFGGGGSGFGGGGFGGGGGGSFGGGGSSGDW